MTTPHEILKMYNEKPQSTAINDLIKYFENILKYTPKANSIPYFFKNIQN